MRGEAGETDDEQDGYISLGTYLLRPRTATNARNKPIPRQIVSHLSKYFVVSNPPRYQTTNQKNTSPP